MCVYVSVYVHMETIGPYRPANMITPVNITFTPLAVPGKCAVCTQDFVNCYYFVALLNVPYTIEEDDYDDVCCASSSISLHMILPIR